MSWTGSMPRSTRSLEIPTTSYDSCLASMSRSPLTLSACVRVLSSSTDRSCPSGGCRPCSCSFASIASCTSWFVSCRQRRIWHSSSARFRSVSYFDLELEMRAWAKKSCWTTLARMRLTSHSMSTFPRARSKATNPSSHVVMAPSLLSSSLSRARSYPYSLTATACEGDGALHQSKSSE
jgi:hypothetical protein